MTRARSRPAAASPSAPNAAPLISCSLEAVCLAIRGGALVVLLQRAKGRWRLPGAAWSGRPSLHLAASALMDWATRSLPPWHEQVAVFERASRAGMNGIALVSVAVFPPETEVPDGTTWCDVAGLPDRLVQDQRVSITAAVTHVRNRMDQVPLATWLVSPLFTLSELQGVYEVLLGHRLHKASFRRLLHASKVVEATAVWRSDGRGRPAQLYRCAPARRR